MDERREIRPRSSGGSIQAAHDILQAVQAQMVVLLCLSQDALVKAGFRKEGIEKLCLLFQRRELGGCIQILSIAERLAPEFALAHKILLSIPGEGQQVDFRLGDAQRV